MKKANISWVTDHLATGGDLSFDEAEAEQQVLDIFEQEVDLVIDVRDEANDEKLWSEEGMPYLWLPTDDREGHHIPVELFNVAVDAAMARIELERKVLIHCHMGVNRGPSVAYAVLLELGYGVVDAFELIRQKRPDAGLLYVEDALKAHIRRHGPMHGDNSINRNQCIQMTKDLGAHLRKVWTSAEKARIKRVIREHRKRDSMYEQAR